MPLEMKTDKEVVLTFLRSDHRFRLVPATVIRTIDIYGSDIYNIAY